MMADRSKRSSQRLLVAVIAGLILAGPGSLAQSEGKRNLNEIPKKVMDSLKSRFPQAVIDKWTSEREGGIAVYDIEFKQAGRKFEADIREDGSIHNWERAIPLRDLPAVVRQTVDSRYPGAVLQEIMQITAVKDGKDELEGYEIVLRTADKSGVEITVAPDGRILEESDVQK